MISKSTQNKRQLNTQPKHYDNFNKSSGVNTQNQSKLSVKSGLLLSSSSSCPMLL